MSKRGPGKVVQKTYKIIPKCLLVLVVQKECPVHFPFFVYVFFFWPFWTRVFDCFRMASRWSAAPSAFEKKRLLNGLEWVLRGGPGSGSSRKPCEEFGPWHIWISYGEWWRAARGFPWNFQQVVWIFENPLNLTPADKGFFFIPSPLRDEGLYLVHFKNPCQTTMGLS